MTNSSARHIAAWVATVKDAASANDIPESSLASLLKCFEGSTFFLDIGTGLGGDGRHRVVFSAYAPKGAVVKHRQMHPIHAAITRAIEQGGGKIKLHQPAPDANYQLRLQLDGIGTTNLPRILFEAGRSRDLTEVKGADYHDIVPANFVLRIGSDRSDVLASIRQRDPEMADLLKQLFELADRWHGSELTTTR